jgi:hypothetical protein
MPQPTSENTYTVAARDLREIADRLAALADRDLPPVTFVNFGLQVAMYEPNDTIVATVNTVGEALAGTTGKTWSTDSGTNYHTARGQVGKVHLSVTQELADPKDARIAALEAQLDELRANPARGTEDGDPDAKPIEHDGYTVNGNELKPVTGGAR